MHRRSRGTSWGSNLIGMRPQEKMRGEELDTEGEELEEFLCKKEQYRVDWRMYKLYIKCIESIKSRKVNFGEC